MGVSVNVDEEQHVLSRTAVCAFENSYYSIVTRGKIERLQTVETLVSYDETGNIRWQVTLPEKTSVSQMSAAGENIYVYGFSGDLTESDVLINHKAMILCYSNTGEMLWGKILEKPDSFYYGTSNSSLIVGIGGLDQENHDDSSSHYFCTFSPDGTIYSAVTFGTTRTFEIRGVSFLPDGRLRMLAIDRAEVALQLYFFDISL